MNNNGFTQVNGSFENATSETQDTSLVVAGTYQGLSDDGLNFIIDLTERQVSYCSMKPKNEDEQVILYNAMNAPKNRIADCINMEITVKDAFVEVVYPVNEKTGIANACPRVVLIDEQGVGYQAVSLGVYGAVKKMFTSFGTPDTWKTSRKFAVKQITKGEKKVLTLEAVPGKK